MAQTKLWAATMAAIKEQQQKKEAFTVFRSFLIGY